MTQKANFKVDPKLTSLLGENYRSSEYALKELIDNAWDAEATEVSISLPEILTEGSIVIQDNGSGMVSKEVLQEYLNIASPRFSRKGERTPNFKRKVRGRKGIGKFSGLLLASTMELETKANGDHSKLTISKKELLIKARDLEDIELPFTQLKCSIKERGTTITLTDLNQALNYPQSEKLREILALQYGKENDFKILINDEPVFRHDVQGQKTSIKENLNCDVEAKVDFTITDKPLASSKSGIILKVGDKVVGKPHLFGLEDDDTLSPRLCRRVVGEVNLPAGSLELTAAGTDVIENDKNFEAVSQVIQQKVKESLSETHGREVNLAKARWQRDLNNRLENVPEHRRGIIEKRLEKLISRSYQEGEKEERIVTLVGLVLDALEKDEYWTVCREIEEAEIVDVMHFADALDRFGLCDLAFMGQQAKRRIQYLDYLERLATNQSTSEEEIHKALEHSLWVFGNEYSLIASNRQLQATLREFLKINYVGDDSTHRPDLFLGSNILGNYLLIEFKKPSITVGRDAESQAKKYADTLGSQLGVSMEILIVGGKVDTKLQSEYTAKPIKFLSYLAIIANARRQLDWTIEQLTQK